MTKVLVIEDDANIADFLKQGLTQKGFDVEIAVTGDRGLETAKSTSPDIVVLDLILPDIDGIDICRELRSRGDTGIVILTARHLIGDRVLGLEAGADDYLPKPFAFEELVARIRSVIRRKKTSAEGVINVNDLEIDMKCRQVRRGERVVELTTREFELLRLLAENAGRPLRRDAIIQRLWGDNFESDTDPVKVYINSLRRKLNSAGEVDLIHTLHGFGYVLRDPVNLSLRTQLSLWFGVVVLIIVFAMTFVTQEFTVWNMDKSVGDALQKRAHIIAAVISSNITTDEESYVQVMDELAKQKLTFVPLLLRLISPSGKVIVEYGKVTASIVQNLDDQIQLPGVSEGRFDTITSIDIEPLRVYTVSVSDPTTHKILAIVQGVESLEQIEEAKRQIWQVGIITGLAGSLMAIFIGLFLLQRMFRPLHAILKTISEIDYNNLRARIREEKHPAELRQLAESLMAMSQRLDMAVDQRRKFIGSISHDIRTPLTALQGQLEVLLLQPTLTIELQKRLERMLSETRRLVRLVKNLLLNVQLESGPNLVTEDVNLSELVDEVVGDMWALTEGLKINIIAPSDLTVYGDRGLLKQLVLNIVDNAIKFTQRGGKVDLILSSEDDWVVLEISDTGIGIHSDDLPHITEPFYRTRTSQRPASEGVGLGLSIVKNIIEMHGGKLEIRSQQKVGTTARVYLPKKVLIVLPERK